MTFSFINSSFSDSASSTTIVVNKPTNTQDDDIMFTIIHRPSWWAPTSVPTWWTLLWSDPATPTYFLYWKLASSEWSSYSWWFSWSVRTWIVTATYRDWFDTSDPIDVVSNTTYTTSNTALRAASMTVSATNSPIIFLWTIFSTSARTFTKPTTPTDTRTEDYDWWSTAWDCWFSVNSMVRTWSWATWDIDATISWAIAVKHAFAVALNSVSAWWWTKSKWWVKLWLWFNS